MREVTRADGTTYEIETRNIGRQPEPIYEQSYEARHRWTHEDIADYADRHRVDEYGNPVVYEDEVEVEADDNDDDVDDDPQSCANCRFMKWHDSFQAWECTVYLKETGPDNILGYSCKSWEVEPPEVVELPKERDPRFAFEAFPPEHAAPGGKIRGLVEMLHEALKLSPGDAARAYPWWDARVEYRAQSIAVAEWLSQLAKELEQ
jgi:hypothetical protein